MLSRSQNYAFTESKLCFHAVKPTFLPRNSYVFKPSKRGFGHLLPYYHYLPPPTNSHITNTLRAFVADGSKVREKAYAREANSCARKDTAKDSQNLKRY
jgi:hypothetical protein